MPVNKQNDANFFSNLNNTLNNYNTPAEQATAGTAQNPYQSALIATASAQSEAKRNLDAAQAAVAAYPNDSTYQAQLQLNQERYAATQQAYTTAQTNFNSANAPIAKLNAAGVDTGTNGDTRTTSQTQSTPAKPLNITNDDSGGAWSPTKPGAGAGTGQQGGDNNPGPNTATTQQALAVFSTSTNQSIVTQPNQLDQYASYTYGISWYVLSPQQYNASVNEQRANLAGWQLLMQSGGAPIKGRNPAFPDDYYMDDLEIDSTVMGGQNMANTATRIKFRVVEPNGITLIENLFRAVQSVYANAQQPNANTGGASKQPTTTETTNYLQAQYCLVIQFYGYDKDGKLIAPAKGSYSTTSGGAAGAGNQQAVITKYYPFTLDTIDFRVANRAIEYEITGVPIPQWYAASTDRGTVPHDFAMTGQTVEQLLSGSPVAAKSVAKSDSAVRETKTAKGTVQAPVTPIPNQYNVPGWNNLSSDVQMRAQQSWFDTYGRQYNADGTPIGGK